MPVLAQCRDDLAARELRAARAELEKLLADPNATPEDIANAIVAAYPKFMDKHLEAAALGDQPLDQRHVVRHRLLGRARQLGLRRSPGRRACRDAVRHLDKLDERR